MSLDDSFEEVGRPSTPPLEFASHDDTDPDADGLLGSSTGEVDYYAVLNLDRTATTEEIKKSYHRMSKYLHPDKHGASDTFLRVARAYDVLSDPKQRMIYDMFGEKGLETSWALAETLKTPDEMMREFHKMERIQKEEEEAAATSLDGEVYCYVSAVESLFPEFGPGGASAPSVERLLITQSVGSRVSNRDTLEISGYAMARNGVGSGGIEAGLRRQFTAKTWGKISGGNTTSRVILHHSFSEYAFGEAMGSYVNRPNQTPGFDWALLLGRQLTETLMATVCFRWGLRDAVEVSLISSGGESSRYRVSAEATPNDLTLSLKYGHKLSESSTALLEASTSMAGGTRVAVGAERAVSRRSKVSLELGLSASEGIVLEAGLSRAGFKFTFPVLIYPSLDLWIAAASAAAPSLAVAAVKTFIINPNKERRKAARIERMRQERMAMTRERAQAVAESMRALAPVAEERRGRERANGGLVIEQAWYGNIQGLTPHVPSPDFPQYIDVANQLQLLIVRSQLRLPASSKADTLDFYDCCPGELKQLFVRYTFHGQLHEVLIQDDEPLVLADRTHVVPDPAVTLFHPVVPDVQPEADAKAF